MSILHAITCSQWYIMLELTQQKGTIPSRLILNDTYMFLANGVKTPKQGNYLATMITFKQEINFLKHEPNSNNIIKGRDNWVFQ